MAFLSPYTVQIFLEEAIVMNFYVKANENSSYIFLFDIIVKKPVMAIYTKRINQHIFYAVRLGFLLRVKTRGRNAFFLSSPVD